MARFYADENFPQPVTNALRQRGHDVLTTAEAGHAGISIPDIDVLKYARLEKRIVLTLNRRHFIRLHEQKTPHAGIVVCTYDPDWPRQAERIHAILSEQTDWNGLLVRVNRSV